MDIARSLMHTGIILILVVSLIILAGCPRQPPATDRNDDRPPALPREITGLESPVAMVFAPDGRVFITERVGRVRVMRDGRLDEEPFATVDVPSLRGYHETGLLGIATPSNFEALPYVYVYHTYSRNGGLFNRVVRFRTDGDARPEAEVVIDDIPGGRIHNGGILVFGPNDRLFISTGETGDAELAQDIESTAGKILRVNPDGAIPSDNPFPNSPVYSYGHRNVFGMAIQPVTNELFITENGPRDNDEINIVRAGGNFGWPVVSGRAGDDRFIDPIHVYARPIAPTQAIFYTGNLFPEVRGTFIFGAYITNELRAIELTGPGRDEVASDRVIADVGERVIGVAQAPDGSIYAVGSNTIKRIDELEGQ